MKKTITKLKDKLKKNKKNAVIITIILLCFCVSLLFGYYVKAKNTIARELSYTPINTGSDGLTATNVQDAIDQLYTFGTTGQMVPVNSYLVQFECNECIQESEVTSQSVPKNGTVTEPANPIKENYQFGGWYSDSELNNAYNFSSPVTSDLTLYAKWETSETPVTYYSVSFESNGGTSVSNQTVEEGSTVTRPTDPTKENYQFGGWCSDATLNNAYDFSTPVTRNLTLYAKWDTETTPTTNYTVTFNSNGGTSVNSQTVAAGGKATRPTDPTKNNYQFDGWYSDSGLTSAYDFNTSVTRNITLYAKWNSGTTPTTNYTVTFNSNGGTSVDSQTVAAGGKATRPTDPTKNNYQFDGWYSDSGLTSAYDFNTSVTRNITLYAKWNSGTTPTTNYTVTFNSNGGTSVNSQTVAAGGKATRPTDPTKNNYQFDGWYSDSGLTSAYDFNTSVTRNITLYAKWNQNVVPSDQSVIENEDGTTTFTANNISLTISSTAVANNNIKKLSVSEISDTEKNRVKGLINNVKDLYGLNINLLNESNNSVNVSNERITYRIPLPPGFSKDDNLKVYRIKGDTKEEISFTIDNGYIVFTCKGTGEFVIAKIDKNKSNSDKPEIIDNGDGTSSVTKPDGSSVTTNTNVITDKGITDFTNEKVSDKEKERLKDLFPDADDVYGTIINLVDKDGNVIDVSNENITYKIPLPPGFSENDNIKIFKIDGDKKTEIPFKIENGYLIFTCKGSGEFAIVKYPKVPSNILKTGQTIIKYGFIISGLTSLVVFGIFISIKLKNKK